MPVPPFTPERITQLKQECLIPQEAQTILQPQQLMMLTERLRERINLPYLNEAEEQQVLCKIVLQIEHFLCTQIPTEMLSLINDTDRGLDEDEAIQLGIRLGRLAQPRLGFAYLSESLEHFAIGFTLAVIINALREGSHFSHAVSQTRGPTVGPDFPFPELA